MMHGHKRSEAHRSQCKIHRETPKSEKSHLRDSLLIPIRLIIEHQVRRGDVVEEMLMPEYQMPNACRSHFTFPANEAIRAHMPRHG